MMETLKGKPMETMHLMHGLHPTGAPSTFKDMGACYSALWAPMVVSTSLRLLASRPVMSMETCGLYPSGRSKDRSPWEHESYALIGSHSPHRVWGQAPVAVCQSTAYTMPKASST